MNDDNEIHPVARLSAADPAADVEPRAGFDADVIARTVGEAAVEAEAEPAVKPEHEAAAVAEPSVEHPAATAAVTDLTAERAHRRPRWIQIAAVAASVALIGGAGFGLGTLTGADATTAASGAGAPISLHGGGGAGAAGLMPEGMAMQNDTAAASGALPKLSAGITDRMSSFGFGFGRNSFSSSGLSTTAGTAAGYTFDARGPSNAATVTALATALGIDGTPQKKDGAWRAGSDDGTAPFLSVALDGTLSFSYSDPVNNPWNCGTDPVMVEPCATPTDLPSESAAIDALRSLISSVGRDADAFEFTSETWEGAFTRSAQAWPLVDGQRIDQGWSIELTSAGVYSAYGSLADLVPLGDYAVVSEQEAFTRLSDPRFGAQMTAMPATGAPMTIMPMDARDLSTATTEEWTPPTEPPATPTAGSPLAWSVNQVEIVSARLGLSSHWQPNGTVLVVPAYEFTDADGGTWSVIAVADSQLDFATE